VTVDTSSAHSVAATAPVAPRTITLGRRSYPLTGPSRRDPRLHLAAVITTLQVLGQTVFHFELSIAQILASLLTCAVLELVIVFATKRIVAWPASALLTGNGVAFILRVPGTRHGDWWSTRGLWIFAATAAVSLLSKYAIRWRGITSSTLRTSAWWVASSCSGRSAPSPSTSGGLVPVRASSSRTP